MSILGMDIGGANLKLATGEKASHSVPFALWKQPQLLTEKLREAMARFPDCDRLAVTMTGELCDCFETKREGVHHILDAVEAVAEGRPTYIWAVKQGFLSVEEARLQHRLVAASNWHATATFMGRFAPQGHALLMDMGSTTTDLIPLMDGVPVARGETDHERMMKGELVYLGVRRTPLMAVGNPSEYASEFFATMHDVLLVLGIEDDNPQDCDTADGRPATRKYAQGRLARMFCSDREQMSEKEIESWANVTLARFAGRFSQRLQSLAEDKKKPLEHIIVCGSGERHCHMIVSYSLQNYPPNQIIRMGSILGPEVSTCAPAFALAVLAKEQGL